MLGDPSGDAFAHLQAESFETIGGGSDGDGEIKFVGGLIHHQQRPSVRTEVFRHLLHDGLQHRIQVERRSEGLGNVVKDAELLHLPLPVCSNLAHGKRVLVWGDCTVARIIAPGFPIQQPGRWA